MSELRSQSFTEIEQFLTGKVYGYPTVGHVVSGDDDVITTVLSVPRRDEGVR